MRSKLKRCLRGHGKKTAMDLDRSLLDRMRSQAGTRRTRRENATALRGLLRWGATQGYFTAEQAELLPLGVYDLIGGVSGTEAPPRRRREREVGQSEDHVSHEELFQLTASNVIVTPAVHSKKGKLKQPQTRSCAPRRPPGSGRCRPPSRARPYPSSTDSANPATPS